jgi:hypothetical protein
LYWSAGILPAGHGGFQPPMRYISGRRMRPQTGRLEAGAPDS